MSTVSKLFSDEQSPPENAHSKITIVGVGQRIAGELSLVDVDEKKLKGELMDLQHGLHYCSSMKLQASTNYDVTTGSKLCIITAGARQREGEDRRSLLERNMHIFKGIVPQLVKYSPNTVICVVSNPVDVMSYVTWKLSGLPRHRVFGTGTELDSSRLRHYLSERLKIDVNNCHGLVIGEHGESSVVVWSGVNVGGVRLMDINPNVGSDKDEENWNDIHRQVIDSATEIIKLKGYTSWAIGLAVGEITEAVLRNKNSIHALSIYSKGYQGIAQDVYVSLPCTVAENGICKILNLPLTDSERLQLQKSAGEIYELVRSTHI